MKNKTALATGSAVLLAALALAAGQFAGSKKTDASATNTMPGVPSARKATLARDNARALPKNHTAATAKAAEWNGRLLELEAELGGREAAVPVLLKQIANSYITRVSGSVMEMAALPPLERHAHLVDLESGVGKEISGILGRLGLDPELHLPVTAAAMQPVWAELIYAGAAPDPASRLMMLKLDRERVSRMQQAMAMNETDAREKAMTDVADWYQSEMRTVVGGPIGR